MRIEFLDQLLQARRWYQTHLKNAHVAHPANRRAWSTRAAISAGAMITLLFALQPSLAGPPFFTDDPVPVEPGHWEINTYSSATFARGATAGAMPAADINYGAIENLQLHVLAPVAFARLSGSDVKFGAGDFEIGAKYRLLTPEASDWWPQIGIYPLLDFPTGDAARNLGTGRTHAFFPIWVQKDFGDWTTYGGGGYWINPGPGNKNYWFAGWVLQYRIIETLALGGEIFHTTSSVSGGSESFGVTVGSKPATGFNLGGTYDFNKTYHVLFSFGRGIENTPANRFSYYLAMQTTF